MGLAALLALGLALAVSLQTWQVARTLTRPPRRGYTWSVSRGIPGTPAELPPAPDGPGPRPFSTFTVRSRGIDLPAWDIPGDEPRGPTVVFTHGWGESRQFGLARLAALLPRARRVILWDLPAHGDAGGSLNMGTTEVDDLLALLAGLPEHEPVVLHGFSLGAGVSIAAAARTSHAVPGSIVGVIAEAPYRFPRTPARNVVRHAGLPAWPSVPLGLGAIGLLRLRAGLTWFQARGPAGFDRAALAGRLTVPLLVLHGANDAVCPVDDGAAIAAATPGGRLVVVPGAGHLTMWTDPLSRPAASQAVTEFLLALNCR